MSRSSSETDAQWGLSLANSCNLYPPQWCICQSRWRSAGHVPSNAGWFPVMNQRFKRRMHSSFVMRVASTVPSARCFMHGGAPSRSSVFRCRRHVIMYPVCLPFATVSLIWALPQVPMTRPCCGSRACVNVFTHGQLLPSLPRPDRYSLKTKRKK